MKEKTLNDVKIILAFSESVMMILGQESALWV